MADSQEVALREVSSTDKEPTKGTDSPEDLGNPIHTLHFSIPSKEAIQALEKFFGVYGT